MVLITSMLFLGVLILGKWFVVFFLNDEFAECLPYLFFLVLSGLFTQQATVLNVMILQQKKTKILSAITICTGIGSIILNISMIPYFGALMAAVNSMIIGLTMFAITWYQAKKTYYVPINFNNIFAIVTLMVFSFICDLYISNTFIEVGVKLALFVICPIFLYKAKVISCPSLQLLYGRYFHKR